MTYIFIKFFNTSLLAQILGAFMCPAKYVAVRNRYPNWNNYLLPCLKVQLSLSPIGISWEFSFSTMATLVILAAVVYKCFWNF